MNKPDDGNYFIKEIACECDSLYKSLEEILQEFNIDYEVNWHSKTGGYISKTEPLVAELYDKIYTILLDRDNPYEVYAEWLIDTTLDTIDDLSDTFYCADIPADNILNLVEAEQSAKEYINEMISKLDNNAQE